LTLTKNWRWSDHFFDQLTLSIVSHSFLWLHGKWFLVSDTLCFSLACQLNCNTQSEITDTNKLPHSVLATDLLMWPAFRTSLYGYQASRIHTKENPYNTDYVQGIFDSEYEGACKLMHIEGWFEIRSELYGIPTGRILYVIIYVLLAFYIVDYLTTM